MQTPSTFQSTLIDPILRDPERFVIEEKDIYDPIDQDTIEDLEYYGVPEAVISLYKSTNGMRFQWFSRENGSVGGEVRFNSHKSMIFNEESLMMQCDMDPQMDERLRRFRTWDVPTMNTLAGFQVDYETGFSPSVYFYNQGDRYARSLEIDAAGYLEMALEAHGYYYWQKVLIDIKNETESPETRQFKSWMPRLFPDFSFEAFEQKYQALRLR